MRGLTSEVQQGLGVLIINSLGVLSEELGVQQGLGVITFRTS